ncbi:ThiF family adenylyltransferase [Luteitalea sp.]|uniref:HesA/MoeB/ThiF family protein n=1 Tax=Luteitalea sp. TaxID=2004800 RepID=UPI0025BB9C63|nr:ThiF family adenylyltransferase [Luteitalea sp.]
MAWSWWNRASTGSAPRTWRAEGIPGALARHAGVPGFDQARLSAAHVLCVGAGGLIGHVAPALARKGVGALTIIDDDDVEPSNLNRQFFHAADVGRNKAEALAGRLLPICTAATRITAVPAAFEAAARGLVVGRADVAVVGVDNDAARLAASRFFRAATTPVVFCAVSADADHGYVLVQAPDGPCPACLMPDVSAGTRPCPGTPAVIDILQAIGALATYAIDACLMARATSWNYRRFSLNRPAEDGAAAIPRRPACPNCGADLEHYQIA